MTHRFDNANDGEVTVDGSSIEYTGLAPITDNLNVTNRVFNFTSTVTDGELITSPLLPLTHTRIQASVAEQVDFTTPTTSLTVNMLSGGANTFDVTSLAWNYGTATNTINGNNGVDTVNFENLGNAATTTWTVNGGGTATWLV